MYSDIRIFPFNKSAPSRIEYRIVTGGRLMDPVSQLSDEVLMSHVAQGNRAHMEPLIRRYANPLLTFIQRMVGDRHRGEELFQEVFLTVWDKRDQYEYPRPFRSWLFAISVNKCRESARRRHPTASLSFEDGVAEPDADPRPEDRAIATETATIISRAVMGLPAQQRAVIVLRIWHGLSYPEIAATVGRTEATVRSHMHHGLAGLRKYLEPRLV
jgi:RNA polymerase sigma-70 factor, ECF subfamily